MGKRKIIRFFVWVGIVAAALPIFWICGIFIYINFFFTLCEATVRNKIAAPDGKMSVFIYSIDCGAATRFNTRASLAPAGGEFDPDLAAQFLHLRGQYDVHVAWLDVTKLEISVSNHAKAFDAESVVQKENLINGVSIIYK